MSNLSWHRVGVGLLLWWALAWRMVVARGHRRRLAGRCRRHCDGAILGAVRSRSASLSPTRDVCTACGLCPAACVFSGADVRSATDLCVASADLPAGPGLRADPGCPCPAAGRLSKRSVRALRRRSEPAVAVGLGAFSVTTSAACSPGALIRADQLALRAGDGSDGSPHYGSGPPAPPRVTCSASFKPPATVPQMLTLRDGERFTNPPFAVESEFPQVGQHVKVTFPFYPCP